MNFNNFTIKSQEIIQQAQLLAQENNNQEITNEHLFQSILNIDENVTPFILKKLAVNINLVNQLVENQLKSLSKVTGGDLQLSRITATTLNEASIIAKKMNDEYVSIEHLILAIYNSKSKIAQILKDQGINKKDLERYEINK